MSGNQELDSELDCFLAEVDGLEGSNEVPTTTDAKVAVPANTTSMSSFGKFTFSTPTERKMARLNEEIKRKKEAIAAANAKLFEPTTTEISSSTNKRRKFQEAGGIGAAPASFENEASILCEKLEFLGGKVGSKFQVACVEIRTRMADYRAGELSLGYVKRKTREVGERLKEEVEKDVPAGWQCNFDRKDQRYVYRNVKTGKTQITHPGEDEEEEDLYEQFQQEIDQIKPGNGDIPQVGPAPIMVAPPAPIIGPQPPPPPPPELPMAVSDIGTFTPPLTDLGPQTKPIIGPAGPPVQPSIGPAGPPVQPIFGPAGPPVQPPSRNVIPPPPPPRVQSPVISRSPMFSKPSMNSPPLMPSPPMMSVRPSIISFPGKPPLMGHPTPVSLAALSVSHQVMRTHNSIVTSSPLSLTSSPLAPTFMAHHHPGHVASFPSFTSFPILRAAAQQALIRPSLVFPMEHGVVVSSPSLVGGGLAALGETYSPGNSDESEGEEESAPQIGVVRVCAPVRYSAAPSASTDAISAASPAETDNKQDSTPTQSTKASSTASKKKRVKSSGLSSKKHKGMNSLVAKWTKVNKHADTALK